MQNVLSGVVQHIGFQIITDGFRRHDTEKNDAEPHDWRIRVLGNDIVVDNNFDNIGNNDNDGINNTISSAQIDEIVNIYANRGIQVFTAGAEWIVPEGFTTPDTFTITKNTSNGSLDTVPVVDVSGTTLFVEKNGKSLYIFFAKLYLLTTLLLA